MYSMHPAFFAYGSCYFHRGDVTVAKIPDKVASSRQLHTVAPWGPYLPLGNFLAPPDQYFVAGTFCTVSWHMCLSTQLVFGVCTTAKI